MNKDYVTLHIVTDAVRYIKVSDCNKESSNFSLTFDRPIKKYKWA